MSEWHEHDFAGQGLRRIIVRNADVRGGGITDCRLRGVDIWNVEIHGELKNVIINGVDVAPLIEAELNRRDPDRAKMRPDTPDGFRDAWAILEERWAATVERARTFTEEQLHQEVGGEWSFIQTLRHLCFATDAWVARMVLGESSPWHPLDLPWDEAPGWEGIPWDRDARPNFAEVLAVRTARQAWSGSRCWSRVAADSGLPAQRVPKDRAQRRVGAPGVRRARPQRAHVESAAPPPASRRAGTARTC